MTATLGLEALPGRCSHGYHVKTQGCTDCGIAFKFAGQAQATSANPDDAARVDAAIKQLAATRQPFSANEARVLHGVKGGVVGARFTAARQAGLIKAVGDESSSSASTHGHRIFRWIGVAA